MQTMLITGAGGFLGSRIAALYTGRYQVVRLTRAQADLTDAKAVLETLLAVRPQLVVHCAAVADTGVAEANEALSYAVNVEGSANVAAACKAVGAKLLYMSSDQVYNGCESLQPLTEEVPLAPETVYGRHKLEAEQRVQSLLPQAVGLRLTWMYDLPVLGLKTNKNLLGNLMHAAMEGKTLKFPVRELRGVTWVREIVQAVPALLALPGGIYNAGATSALDETTYALALTAAHALGATDPSRLVEPDLLRYAAHVRNLNMDTGKLAAHDIVFSASVQGLHRCLRAYGLAQEPSATQENGKEG